jgi:hypothetical protein
VWSAAVEGTITAAKRIIMIVYHIRETESSLKQGKFPEDRRNIWVYYECLPTASLKKTAE